ncbi:hypothetical protein PT285_09600 [Lactobacillus sp. ESL0791]|uniref:hypothetical protein n=1 Tax=Lactobacillus sp. ESL0791 TaxID=2983234 RepID=UPI0023F70747|nr:hypothetical protein [Lactobacillus sp. ESL0791]MDF7639653.1 hypothetical protein [Lactobacillus sp. ESL0791]
MKHYKSPLPKLKKLILITILLFILFFLVIPFFTFSNHNKNRDLSYKDNAITELKKPAGKQAVLKKLRRYHWLKKNYAKSVTLNYSTARVYSDWYHAIGPNFSIQGYINNDPGLKIEIVKGDNSDHKTDSRDLTSGSFKINHHQFWLHITSEKLYLQRFYYKITNSQRLEAYAYHNKQSLQKIISQFAWKKTDFVKKINFDYDTAMDDINYGNIINGYINGDKELAFSVGLSKSPKVYILNKNGNLWSKNVQKTYKWKKNDFVVAT